VITPVVFLTATLMEPEAIFILLACGLCPCEVRRSSSLSEGPRFEAKKVVLGLLIRRLAFYGVQHARRWRCGPQAPHSCQCCTVAQRGVGDDHVIQQARASARASSSLNLVPGYGLVYDYEGQLPWMS
jgi:hypothetical protein